MPHRQFLEIVHQFAALPKLDGQARKITFAGGEPLLYCGIVDVIGFAKEQGLVTSLVTNGLHLTPGILARLTPILDWCAISVDSADTVTNRLIGRCTAKGTVLSKEDYIIRARTLREAKVHLKINTVVNRRNLLEDFTPFINAAYPERWKILQCSQMEGENDADFDRWAITPEEFDDFLNYHHEKLGKTDIALVPETQNDIRGTYAIVAPNGCFLDNSDGTCRYSRPIVEVGIETAFSDVRFSSERFRQRNGDYNFTTGKNRSRNN